MVRQNKAAILSPIEHPFDFERSQNRKAVFESTLKKHFRVQFWPSASSLNTPTWTKLSRTICRLFESLRKKIFDPSKPIEIATPTRMGVLESPKLGFTAPYFASIRTPLQT